MTLRLLRRPVASGDCLSSAVSIRQYPGEVTRELWIQLTGYGQRYTPAILVADRITGVSDRNSAAHDRNAHHALSTECSEGAAPHARARPSSTAGHSRRRPCVRCQINADMAIRDAKCQLQKFAVPQPALRMIASTSRFALDEVIQ